MDIRAIQRVLEQRLDADVRMAPKEMPAWVDPVDLACEVRIGGDAWILAIEAKAAKEASARESTRDGAIEAGEAAEAEARSSPPRSGAAHAVNRRMGGLQSSPDAPFSAGPAPR